MNFSKIRFLLLCLGAFWIIWPIFTMFNEGMRVDLGPLMSGRGSSYVGRFFQPQGGIRYNPLTFIRAFTLENFPRAVLNSTVIAAISIGLALAVGILAAYALARHQFKGRGIVTLLVLVLRTITPLAVIVPFFIIYGQIGLFDTHIGMGLVYLIINIPIVTFMMRGFFADIPQSIYEAASAGGASEFQVLRKVALPLVIPGILATTIFAFVATWNEFLFAQFLSGIQAKPVSRGVWSGFAEAIESFKVLDFDELNANATLAMIPALLLSFMIRKYVARGFTLGTAR
jgi:ABC-type glycerol-3-phosphate transport system permease component